MGERADCVGDASEMGNEQSGDGRVVVQGRKRDSIKPESTHRYDETYNEYERLPANNNTLGPNLLLTDLQVSKTKHQPTTGADQDREPENV